jgi:YD repeat-containing protein
VQIFDNSDRQFQIMLAILRCRGSANDRFYLARSMITFDSLASPTKGQVFKNTYDAVGNIITQDENNLRSTRYTYDEIDRETAATTIYYDGTSINNQTEYESLLKDELPIDSLMLTMTLY